MGWDGILYGVDLSACVYEFVCVHAYVFVCVCVRTRVCVT